MPRALIGGWIVVLLLSGLLVSSGLSGPASPGTAIRSQPLPPPAVGTCFADSFNPTEVPCTDDHEAEVVLGWHGRLPPMDLDPAEYPLDEFPRDDPTSYCAVAAVNHTGWSRRITPAPGQVWRTQYQPNWSIIITHGPGSPLLDDWFWSACLLVATDATGLPITFDRSVAAAADGSPIVLPSEWVGCLEGESTWINQNVPCSQPHRRQEIAYGLVPATSAEIRLVEERDVEWTRMQESGEMTDLTSPPEIETTDPTIRNGCRSIIESAMGSSLDDRATELRMVVDLRFLDYDGDLVKPTDSTVEPEKVWVGCAVVAVGDRDLAGSLVGVGSGPLPWD